MCRSHVQGRALEEEEFAFLHCWKILKDKLKWIERLKENWRAKKTSNKKHKTTTNSTASRNTKTTTNSTASVVVAAALDGFLVVSALGAAVTANDVGDWFVVVLCFLLLFFLAHPISFYLSIHLGLSFNIFQQCRKANFLFIWSSSLNIIHAFAIYTFQTKINMKIK